MSLAVMSLGATDAPAATKASKAVGGALEKIAAFIPTEVVALYISIWGIWSPKGDDRWIMFYGALVLIPIFVAIVLFEQKKDGKTVSIPKSIGVWVFGSISFVTWSMALPETPLGGLVPDANLVGGIAVLLTAALLPPIAALLGIEP